MKHFARPRSLLKGPVCLFGDGVLGVVTVNGIQLTEAGRNETMDLSEIDDWGLDYDGGD